MKNRALGLAGLAVLALFPLAGHAADKPDAGAPAAVAERWCLQRAVDEDQNLVFITANLGYRTFSDKASWSWLLQINVTTLHQNPRGHPTDDEAQVLNQLEDQLTAQLKGVTGVHFIGRVTTKGFRELVYYVKDAEKANALLTGLTQKRQPRSWEYRMTKDPRWKHADDLIAGERECL